MIKFDNSRLELELTVVYPSHIVIILTQLHPSESTEDLYDNYRLLLSAAPQSGVLRTSCKYLTCYGWLFDHFATYNF
jgi:hypothetical protein